jgi:uncharacterized protein (DUF983 family)
VVGDCLAFFVANPEFAMLFEPVNPILVGLKARCPRCGKGALLEQGIAVRKSCTACGLDYGFAASGDGPAVFAILILGAVMMGGALFLEFRYDPPVWVHVVVWGILTPLVALGLLRVLKGVLISLQYANRAEEGRFKKD